MTTTVDPDVIRSLDPRRSYLPKPQPAVTADGEAVTERIPAPGRGALASLSTDDLRREIERRQKAAVRLQARRDELAAELADIQAQLKAMGALHNPTSTIQSVVRPPKSTGPRKPRAIVSPAEAAELVKANGYASTSKNLAMTVSNTLAKDARVKRVGRGSYERVG